MKKPFIPAVLLALLALCAGVRAEEAVAKHWYQLFLQQDGRQKSVVGSSVFPAEEFASILTGKDFVQLEDLRLPVVAVGDETVLAWTRSGDKLASPRFFVNPRFVVYFLEWAADPAPPLLPKPGTAGAPVEKPGDSVKEASPLDFLADIPALKQVTLSITEPEFLQILQEQKLAHDRTTSDQKTTYYVKVTKDATVYFGFKDAQCTGIQRLLPE